MKEHGSLFTCSLFLFPATERSSLLPELWLLRPRVGPASKVDAPTCSLRSISRGPGPGGGCPPHTHTHLRGQRAPSGEPCGPRGGPPCGCARVSLIINEAPPRSPYAHWPVACFLFQKLLFLPSLHCPLGFLSFHLWARALCILKALTRLGKPYPRPFEANVAGASRSLSAAFHAARGAASHTRDAPL